MTSDARSNATGAANGMRTGGASRPKANGRDIVSDRVQMQIGRELRAIYDAVLLEPVPDNLLELLHQADFPAKKPIPDRD